MKSQAQLSKLLAMTLVLGLFLLLVTAGTSRADDRNLFRSNSAGPYVMAIIDTSSSMTDDLLGNSPGKWAEGDDPSSRLYLAKSALYEVVSKIDPGVRFGWSHFEQEGLSVTHKLYLYKRDPASANPPWWAEVRHPAIGDFSEFGGTKEELLTSCSSTPGSSEMGKIKDSRKLGYTGNQDTVYRVRGTDGLRYEVTYKANPSVWGRTPMDVTIRVRRYTGGSCTTSGGYDKTAVVRFVGAYTQDNEGLVYSDATGGLGFSYIDGDWNLSGDKWDPNNNTATGTGDDEGPLTYYTKADPLLRDVARGTFARGDTIVWDWIEHPDRTPPAPGFEMSAREELLCRLAPNTCVAGEYKVDADGNKIPDFRVARYFEDAPVTGTTMLDGVRVCAPIASASTCLPLRAQYRTANIAGNIRRLAPIQNGNGTPIGGSLKSFHEYLVIWDPIAKNTTTGDSAYNCREKYLLMLTDGRNNSGVVEPWVTDLYDDFKVRTFGVSFNAAGGDDWKDLPTLADWGGTGRMDRDGNGIKDCLQFTYKDALGVEKDICDTRDPLGNVVVDDFSPCPTPVGSDCKIEGPIIAGSRDALVQQLNNLFSSITPKPTAFASAGVPEAQAESQESVFLGSFLPLEGQPTWPGSVRHFIRPLPLALVDGAFLPDETQTCDGLDPVVGCFAWEAQDQMLGLGTGSFDQVPTDVVSATELDAAIGDATDQRRLFYAQEPPLASATATYVGLTGRLLEEPTVTTDKYDLWDGFGITYIPANVTSEAAAQATAFSIMRNTVIEKSAPNPLEPGTVTWILGDVFHSDPSILGAPNRFEYMSANLKGNGACRDAGMDFDPTKLGYRCFFEQHRLRRKVLFVGSNDAQLHAFDAGFFESDIVDNEEKGEFNPGTGQEVFAYVPRALLPRLKELNGGGQHAFSLDGTVVIDDVFMDPNHAGAPDPDERIWRSVLIGGLREGGVGYHALDVTQPDWLAQGSDALKTLVPDDKGNYVPSCIKNYTASDCGPNKYGTVLWEFTDLNNSGLAADEDGNSYPDLGYTWSQPNTGRIEVCTEATFPCPTNKIEDRFVAIFGGGNCAAPGRPGPQCPDKVDQTGNFLYMVDIETGQAIYKRDVLGSVPSEPAAVDTDRDGILDTIYFGTTAGFLYKVDVSKPVEVATNLTVPGGERIADALWEPFAIFDTEDRPIYHPPSVVFVALKGRYAVTWGTGDREHLWRAQPLKQRFYALLDTGFNTATGYDAGDLQGIPASSTLSYADLLLDPTSGSGSIPGYYLEFGDDERAITRTFTVAGITIFSTFLPEASSFSGTCQSNGTTNVYTIFTVSGNPLGSAERFRQIDGFISNPFTEQSATKPVDKDGDGEPDDTSDDLTDDLRDIMETIKDQMPDECRFSNVTINVKAIRSDTGVEFLAPIPVCMIEKNWKEF